MEASQPSRSNRRIHFVRAGTEPPTSAGPQVFQPAESIYVPAAPPPTMVTSLSQSDMDTIARSLSRQILKSGKDSTPMYVPQWRQKESVPIYRFETAVPPKDLLPTSLWAWVQQQDFSSHVDQAVRVPVHKRVPNTYQDGCPIQTEELTVFHATRAGLLHAILKGGLAPSIPSHGVEGLWCFARLQEAAFTWGSSIVEELAGIVLEIQVPKFLLSETSPNTPTDSTRGLLSNVKIRASGADGHFRWVVAGKFLNSAIPVRVTAILIRSTSEAQLLFGQRLREAIRQSVSWVLCRPLQDILAETDVDFIPEGRIQKQPRLMEDMRQRVATAAEQALQILRRSDQSDEQFWEEVGARVTKKMGTQVARLVERRLIYASSMGVRSVQSLYKTGDAVHGALKDSEDLYMSYP